MKCCNFLDHVLSTAGALHSSSCQPPFLGWFEAENLLAFLQERDSWDHTRVLDLLDRFD